MSTELIFTGKPHQDYNNILAVLDAFAIKRCVDLKINEEKLYRIVFGIYQDFPCVDGLEGASVFKKSANFLCYFISERVVESPFPEGKLKKDWRNINNHENVILGLFIVAKALLGATINKTDGTGDFIIEHPIQLSKHSYGDMIYALSQATPSTSFHVVTILLEQLVYKNNPEAQYQNQMVSLA